MAAALQCGEGQSIVKVWGRGGHAKDVRGLVMQLNAAAGRGEDPTVITAVAGLASRPGARNQEPPRLAARGRVMGHVAGASFTHGPAAHDALRNVRPEEAMWERSPMFPSGNLLTCDGVGTGIDSWNESRSGRVVQARTEGVSSWGEGYPDAMVFGTSNAHEGGGLETAREKASPWRPTGAAGSGGRRGSRWGAFASSMGTVDGAHKRRSAQQVSLRKDISCVACSANRHRVC